MAVIFPLQGVLCETGWWAHGWPWWCRRSGTEDFLSSWHMARDASERTWQFSRAFTTPACCQWGTVARYVLRKQKNKPTQTYYRCLQERVWNALGRCKYIASLPTVPPLQWYKVTMRLGIWNLYPPLFYSYDEIAGLIATFGIWFLRVFLFCFALMLHLMCLS